MSSFSKAKESKIFHICKYFVKKMHIKITNPETTHQIVFLCAVCIRAHARRAYAHFTAHYIQRTPRAQACTPHTGAWVSSFKGAAKLQVLCEICKYTRRKAASLFSSHTRQICIIRKFLVVIAKPLNYVIMNSKRIAQTLERAKESLQNAYWTMDIVGDELLEMEDQEKHNELWQVQCICDAIKGQLETIIERYKDLPF